MTPAVKLLALAAGAGLVVAVLADGDDAPQPATGRTVLASGTYGTSRFEVRRHGYDGVAWSIDGVDVGTAATLRLALDDAFGSLATRASAEAVVLFTANDVQAVTVQPDSDGWAWAAFDGTGLPPTTLLKDAVAGQGVEPTRGAALIAAMDALDL